MEVWAIILFIVGIGLLAVEAYVPGFGVAGILGIILLIAGVVIVAGSVFEALLLILLLVLIVGGIFAFVIWRASTGRMAKSRLILKERLVKDAGFTSSEDLSGLIGKQGKTLTVLRPAGMAVFDDAKVDVVSEGEFLEAGAAVLVERVEGRRVIVKKVGQP